MPLRGEFELATIDIKAYKKEWVNILRDVNANAILDWLIEATSQIPIWSGASIATFLPLASQIGFGLPTTPKAGVRSRVSLGARLSDGDVIQDDQNLRYGFSYQTRLDHLIYNNFFNANSSPDPTLFSRLLNPGPYRFEVAANRAALEQYKTIVAPDVPIKIKKLRSR